MCVCTYVCVYNQVKLERARHTEETQAEHTRTHMTMLLRVHVCVHVCVWVCVCVCVQVCVCACVCVCITMPTSSVHVAPKKRGLNTHVHT